MYNRLLVVILILFYTSNGYSQHPAIDSLNISGHLLDLQFSKAENDSMQNGVAQNKSAYQQIRETTIPNSNWPAILFNPILPEMDFGKSQLPIIWGNSSPIKKPKSEAEIAFLTIEDLAHLIKSKQLSSVELTKIYLNRLKKYGDTLACVVTLTEDLALKQAKKADEEIANGRYRGILHGIPYGVKDLVAVKSYKTTWGAMPYKDQLIDETATIVTRLSEAGAVLVAKLSMGALAWGDVWFNGITKNPWNLKQGSSGSSAGSASATAAGLVAFSIGTETLGSIVSPSTRCGVSGLRPTYGRVSRHGAMALSWSMDKIGPMTRSARDCAIVFDAIQGIDNIDPTLVEMPFNYNAKRKLSDLKIGYFKSLFDRDYNNKTNDQKSLEVLKSLGANLQPVDLNIKLPVGALRLILSAEAAAAFDELTRSNRDSLLVRQIVNAWPNVFRTARFIPAVEYIQANRLRRQLQEAFYQVIKSYDVIVTPSFGGPQLLITNLTGHPCMVVPNGFTQEGSPTSISFIGNLYDEASVIEAAAAYQAASDFNKKHPAMFLK